MLRNADFKDRYREHHMSPCNIDEIIGFDYIKTLIYTNLVAGITIRFSTCIMKYCVADI